MTEKVVLIIQARMGSSRLPGKSLLDLSGKSLVGHILERVKRCKNIDKIVLAIPGTEQNEPLYRVGMEEKIEVFKGSEHDLLERYYQAALYYNVDVVIRLPADNVAPEPEEIDRIVSYHLSLKQRGFTSNLAEINSSGYPDGIGAEVFDFRLLEEARSKCPSQRLREHVHLNFFDYATQQAVDDIWCPINTLRCPVEFRRPDLVLDVNTYEQYRYIKAMYEYLYPINPYFNIKDIIDWHDNIWINNLTMDVIHEPA